MIIGNTGHGLKAVQSTKAADPATQGRKLVVVDAVIAAEREGREQCQIRKRRPVTDEPFSPVEMTKCHMVVHDAERFAGTGAKMRFVTSGLKESFKPRSDRRSQSRCREMQPHCHLAEGSTFLRQPTARWVMRLCQVE